MKVKKTYSKQEPATLGVSHAKDAFDRLLPEKLTENTAFDEKPKARGDSRSDKKRKIKEKKHLELNLEDHEQKRIKVKKILDSSLDLANDELYKAYLKEKKKKKAIHDKKLNKKRLELKRPMISTPVHKKQRQKFARPSFEASPILNPSDDSPLPIPKMFIEKLAQKRLKEIQEQENAMETTVIKESKALMAEAKNKKPLKSSENVLGEQRRTILQDKSFEIHKRKKTVKKTETISKTDSGKEENGFLKSFGSQLKIIGSPETRKTSGSLIVRECSEVSESIPVPENSGSVRSSELQIVLEADKTLVSLVSLPGMLPGETQDDGETAIIPSKPHKTIGFNLAPAIAEIPLRSPGETDRKSTEPEKPSFRPGKWRRSLIAWRSSHISAEPNRRSSSRRSIFFKESTLQEVNESVLLEQSDEENLQPALSILDASIKCADFFHDQRKTSQRKTSVFQRTSIFYPLIDADEASSALSARQIVLRRCGQQEPEAFDEIYSENNIPNCCKIGEGVYGEVFMFKERATLQPIVLKIIPIEGDQEINGEPQKRFDEILQEIVISMELSGLRHGLDYATDGFVNVKRVSCVKGAYPQHLIDEWELFRDNKIGGSENDHPEVFSDDQLYIVFELCNGGKDLEAFKFNDAEEAHSVFLQTALTLAVAERKFLFEHRDLHWGNILIAPTTEKFTEFRINGEIVKLLTHGVKVTIIDYSLSRMVYDGAVLYDNLARDEELFNSTGDYQFEIYRLMRNRLDNNFERFEPYTNLLWLHYIIDKLINGARYRYTKSKKHRAAINEMMQTRDELLSPTYNSAHGYVSQLDL